MKKKQILYIGIIVAGFLVALQIYRTTLTSNVPTRAPILSPSVVSISKSAHTTELYKYADGIRFEIATTTQKQKEGLSGRHIINNNYGMLFVFPQDGSYGIWMKDMNVPIDIIWLSDNGTIVSIKNAIATSTYPNVFYPPTKVRYVLETRSGFARSRSWSVGSVVVLPVPY